jgi:EpsI family protein
MSTADVPSLQQAHPSRLESAPASPQACLSAAALARDLRLHAGLVVVALVCLYAAVFKDLWDLWMTREDYSHGFLIPLISLYLVKTKWADIANLSIKPVPVLGFGMVLLSLTGLAVGVAGGVITLSSVSFIGTLIGLTLMLFGVAYMRALSLPFAYLIFMTPVLDVLVEPLHHPLQLLAANVVSALFATAGVPTYLDRTFIHFPNGILEVAVQCSGAGYLISILAIGLPLAFLALSTWWSRVTLIVAALVISILGNWARITLIGTIGYLSGWGPQVHGPLHMLQGMLVYWIGFGALFAGAWVLARIERGRMKPVGRPTIASASSITPAWQIWRRHWWVALATLVMATVYLYGYDRGPVAAKQSFALLPLTIGEWVAVGTQHVSPVVKIPRADQELVRLYRKADGTAVCLYIADLDSQTQGRELVNYLTAPLHQDATETKLIVGDHSLSVNTGFWDENHSKTPILFWYALHGRAVADRYQAKVATIVQALAHEGSNGALVLISGVAKGGGQEDVAGSLKDFAQDLVPVVRSYLP